MYRILQQEGIDLPRYAVLNRDPDKPDGQCAVPKGQALTVPSGMVNILSLSPLLVLYLSGHS